MRTWMDFNVISNCKLDPSQRNSQNYFIKVAQLLNLHNFINVILHNWDLKPSTNHHSNQHESQHTVYYPVITSLLPWKLRPPHGTSTGLQPSKKIRECCHRCVTTPMLTTSQSRSQNSSGLQDLNISSFIMDASQNPRAAQIHSYPLSLIHCYKVDLEPMVNSTTLGL